MLPSAAATPNVPPSVFTSTNEAATQFAAGQAAGGVLSPTVAVLTEGVLKTMWLTKLKAVALVLVLAALVGGGLTAVAQTFRPEGTTVAAETNATDIPADAEKKPSDTKTTEGPGDGLPAVSRSMVEKAVRLADGDWLVYRYRPVSDSGVQVYRMNPTLTKRRWQAQCKGLGQFHEQFGQRVEADVVGDQVIITCRTVGGSGGEGTSFEERLDLATGKQVERKTTQK
jgi:hypothetical protein